MEPKICRVHSNRALVPILGEINRIRILISKAAKIHFNNIFCPVLDVLKVFSSQIFPQKICFAVEQRK
jgi:hypothetical protein